MILLTFTIRPKISGNFSMSMPIIKVGIVIIVISGILWGSPVFANMSKPRQIHERKEFVVGNPEYYREYLSILAKRGPSSDGAITIPIPLDKTKMVVTRDVITGIDVNQDGYNDVIEGRTFRLGYGTVEKPYNWAAITSLYFGSKDRIHQQPDINNAAMVTEALAASAWEESARQMVVQRDDKVFDTNVSAAVHSVLTFAFNSGGYLGLIEENNHDSLGKEAQKSSDRLADELPKEFLFAAQAIKRHIGSESDVHYAQRLRNIVTRIEDDNVQLPGQPRINELWNHYPKFPKRRDGLYKRLLGLTMLEKDPEKEATLLRKMASFIEHQKKRGGLFDASERGFAAAANEFAREKGYSDYAEYRVEKLYGITVTAYENMVTTFLEQQQPRIRTAVAEIKKHIDGARPVWELNMYRLLAQSMQRKLDALGIDKEPTLSVEESVAVTKRFFKDLGYDLDALPNGGRITFDLRPRKDKTQGGFQVSIEDGREQVIFASLPEGLDLSDLAEFIHEIGHAIDYYSAAVVSDESAFGGGKFRSYTVKEAYAEAFKDIIFTHEWADKYLPPYSAFSNPEVRNVVVNGWQDINAWWNSVMIARALWEINLYQDKDTGGSFRPMADRLNYWSDLGLRYLGYDDVGIPASVVSKLNTNIWGDYLHPAWQPLHYCSYSAGRSLRAKMVEDLTSAIKSGETGKMGERLRRFFERDEFVFSIRDAENEYKRF